VVPVWNTCYKAADRVRVAPAELQNVLTAAFMRARERGARAAASLAGVVAAVRRRFAEIRLPEIPGGDPVMFGTAVGISVIVGASLIVLIGSTLRQRGDDLQSVDSVSIGSRDSLVVDERRTFGPLPRDVLRTEQDLAPAGSEDGLLPDIGQSAAVARNPADLADTDELADENENIVAAMPLLDATEGRHDEFGPPQPEALLPNPSYPLPEARLPEPTVRPQWLANAVEPQRGAGERPMIAIVIDDAGVAEVRTARAIALPAPLTIAFIPYGRNLEAQTRLARKHGHELLLHIPMEPDSGAVDPGPNALLTSLDGNEIMRRFRWALARFDGYVGVNNHMGSKFMARPDLVAPLLSEMNARGLLFLDSRTDKSTVGAELAGKMHLPHASRQVFLDNDLEAGKIAAQLKRLESVALRQGHAIAIGHPHDVTVDVLAQWIPQARARGFDLVPVSAIVKLAYGEGSQNQLAAARGREPDRLLGGAQ